MTIGMLIVLGLVVGEIVTIKKVNKQEKAIQKLKKKLDKQK